MSQRVGVADSRELLRLIVPLRDHAEWIDGEDRSVGFLDQIRELRSERCALVARVHALLVEAEHHDRAASNQCLLISRLFFRGFG